MTAFKQVAASLVIGRQHFHVAKQTEAGHEVGKKSNPNQCNKRL